VRRVCTERIGEPFLYSALIRTTSKRDWALSQRMQNVYFEDLEVGSVHLGRECVCDKDEMLEFSRRNDPWPFHVDEAAAARSPFGGVVASGGFIITLWYRSLIEIYNTPRATW